MNQILWRRRFRFAHTRLRELVMITRGLLFTRHPILAHIIPMRRCNLACSYCNEYDDYSAPVPAEVMFERLDKLADLGTTAIIISGGEPLMHPQIESIIKKIRQCGMLACLITNGYLLTQERIKALNRAGLEYMQISITHSRFPTSNPLSTPKSSISYGISTGSQRCHNHPLLLFPHRETLF